MYDRLELASSWSLRQHYSDNLTDAGRGRQGHAICDDRTTVHDNDFLLFDTRFKIETLNRPRPMCKRCERLAADRGKTDLLGALARSFEVEKR